MNGLPLFDFLRNFKKNFMKKVFFLLFAIVSLGLVAFMKKDGLQIGDAVPLPVLKIKDISGMEISFTEAKKENGLLVMFSCNTCPVVIKNQERTKEICAFALKNKIGVVLLNSNEDKRNSDDSYEAMQQYAKNQSYSWYYAVDQNSTIADAFGANRTPECYLFNKELKLAYHGAIDDNAMEPENVTRKHLQIAIAELVANTDITQKTSRSVGCTIKRKS
jgi:hypothetical protein